MAKGVEFIQEPEERPYGVEALCRDNSGNWMVLVEPRAYSPEDFEGTGPRLTRLSGPTAERRRGISRHSRGGGHAEPTGGHPGREVVAAEPAGSSRRS